MNVCNYARVWWGHILVHISEPSPRKDMKSDFQIAMLPLHQTFPFLCRLCHNLHGCPRPVACVVPCQQPQPLRRVLLADGAEVAGIDRAQAAAEGHPVGALKGTWRAQSWPWMLT